MIVLTLRTDNRLVFVQHGQEAENDRDGRLQLDLFLVDKWG